MFCNMDWTVEKNLEISELIITSTKKEATLCNEITLVQSIMYTIYILYHTLFWLIFLFALQWSFSINNVL